MNKTITLKVKHIVVFFLIVTLVLVIGGSIWKYRTWCAENPVVSFSIGDGNAGEEKLKLETPRISFYGRNDIEPSTHFYLILDEIWIQQETICHILLTEYIESDIKLKIDVKNNQTCFIYSGTAVNKKGKTVDFHREVALDFVLDTKITHM